MERDKIYERNFIFHKWNYRNGVIGYELAERAKIVRNFVQDYIEIFKCHKRLGEIMAEVEFAEEEDNVESLESVIEALSQEIRSKLID